MRSKPRHRLIMGKNCVQEVVRQAPERLVAVYTAKEDPLIEELQEKNIPVHYVTKKELKVLVNSESHQSFVAAVHERPTRSLRDFLKDSAHKDKSLVLALDTIEDPQNLGAILRAAECFGVDAVIYSKNRGTDVTPAASKASVGASELVEILKVSNLAEAVRQFKDAEYTIVAADATPAAQRLNSYGFADKTLLIMGSEGKGIQKLILTLVDDILYIPMQGHISSLNVSQATAVILSAWSA